jgi:uncharacterized membrane protein YedE/YeeE
MKRDLLLFLLAAGLGATLNRIGFSDWDAVRGMFVFQDLRMFLAFCTAVVFLVAAWKLIPRLGGPQIEFHHRPIHKGTLLGGLVFGAGWALCGACPAIALVQIGEGQLAAGYTLLGIFVGNWLYGVLHARVLRWDTGRCVDD